MVFYFTATGNCLYAARRFDEAPRSIPQELKSGSLSYTDETIGIVAPIYAGKLPKIVRQFLEKAAFRTDYFYMILTYGHADSVAGQWSKHFAKRMGIRVDLIRTVEMVDNYLPAFDMDEERRIDRPVEEQLDRALESVRRREKGIPAPSAGGLAAYVAVSLRDRAQPEFDNGWQIMVTDACVGCGICAKVCPVGNFSVQNGAAVRREETCEFCLACANNCPKKAIGLRIADKNPESRYRNEHVTLAEIIAANQQG